MSFAKIGIAGAGAYYLPATALQLPPSMHERAVYSYGTRGMAHELCFEDPGTTWRARRVSTHPIVPRSLCPVQPFSISPGRPNAALEGKLTPPLSRNLEQSSIQRLDWTTDQIDRLSIDIDSIPKGYRACGGYVTAEVLLMGLAWLEAEAAAVLLGLPRIGLIDFRRSTVTVEIGQSTRGR